MSFKSEETIVAKAPTVDCCSTTTGLNLNQDTISPIAFDGAFACTGGTRSFESLAEMAPQTGGDQYGVGINGAQSPENAFIIDGISRKSPHGWHHRQSAYH